MKKRTCLGKIFPRRVKGLFLAGIIAMPAVGIAAIEKNNPFAMTVNKLVNVSGKVVDQDGNPVVGATVLVKGTKTGVKTDQNGVFRINLPEGNTIIVVSYVGYKVTEVNMAGQQNVTIKLEVSDNAMDEIVVTGYGTQRRSEIVGSVATISGEELMDIPAPNIAGALRNRIAGVGVSQESGRPGARISLNVRGSSISSNAPRGATSEPLYIIDGITVDADVFDNLDASMVENISILKDASAAIYGAAGAKGVVLVTTKRGKQGKPSISYNGYLGVTDMATKPDLLSAYELGVFLNEGFRTNNSPAGDYFSLQDLEYLKGLNTESWLDQLWQPAVMQRHNVSVSGGGERVTFFVGGGYQNENANYAGMKQDKYTMRSGLTATILEGLKADINFSVDHRVRDSKNGLNATDQAFYGAMLSTPDWIPLTIDGKPVFVDRTGTRNPLGILNSGSYQRNKLQNYRVNANLTYQPKFLKGFTAKFQVSQGGGNTTSSQYNAPYKLYAFEPIGSNNQFYSSQPAENHERDGLAATSASLTTSLARDNSYQGFITLSYANTFGKHSVDAVVGGEQTVSDNEFFSGRWDNQLIPGTDDYWAFDQNRYVLPIGGRTINETTKRSFFGRVGYDFDKKYLVQLVSRLDASSNFASGNRWGLSPSIGFGWVVSQENFFTENVSFVNFLKLKANVGIAGDDRVAERLWQDRYNLDLNNGYMFGENNYGIGLNPAEYPNPFITWEKKRTINFGIESSMFNNKLNIGMEFFQNKVFDGFDRGGNEITPHYAGLLPPIINYRESYNWGSEFTVGYNTKIGPDFNISTNINFGWGNSIVTRVLYAPGDFRVSDLSDGSWMGTKFGVDPNVYNNNNIGYKVVGMFRTQDQVDAFLAENPNYRINGTVPQPGWLMYEDTNGDGTISTLDQTLLFDRTNSAFSSGLTVNLSYKSVSLNTNVFTRFGGKVFIDGNARAKAGVGRNVMSFWKDRWTPDNPMEGTYPRADDPLINSNADFWALNGTTIRINNMTLAYKIPTNVTSRIGMSNARVLLTGNNLWTLVNPFSYKDPYTGNAYDYPTVRTISVGITANL
ncbi:SusC/RagA family TonB-linked outer membrane protein [Sphingobacterium olei]|uniref:SusC/RagA family TonB-linked outer membrane protein n=1 Tax=Sphingobacterium olei TaxID=2571155 RepID=A0A4U0P4A6_9SPHI|nr:SusC/RagA family TonB-linked outer membrane protein [Sphingobacterium olei]TJZ62153.1 SusC/RagA family TonB-linked outer membrane protein [Sphingobacterium olei]